MKATSPFLTGKKQSHYLSFAYLLLLTCGLLFITHSIYQYLQSYQFTPIESSQDYVSIGYKYQVAPSKNFSINDVLNNDNNFIAIENLTASFSQEVHWLKYFVKNNVSQPLDLVLHIDNPNLSQLKLYQVTPASNEQPLINEITIQLPVFPNHAFSLAPNSSATFIVKTQTLKHPFVPLMLYSEENFFNKKHIVQICFIIFISVILVMAFYNLVIYSTLKDKIYLIYVTYLIFCFLILSNANGFGFYIFGEEIQEWLKNYSIFFKNIVILCLVFFTLYFLKYDQRPSKVYKFIVFGVWIYALLSVAFFFYSPSLQTQFFFTTLPFFYVLCISLIIPRIKNDYKWARFYFLSWIPLLAGTAIQPLVALNLLEYSFFTRYAFLFAVCVEVLFMACALAERMRRYEQEKVKGMSYHPESNIPRKMFIESTLAGLISQNKKSTHVLVIKPENIDNISLHIEDTAKLKLYKKLYTALSKTVSNNKEVIALSNKQEKLCLLENNRLALVVKNNNNSEALSTLISRIQDTVFEHYQIENFAITLTAEVGVAKFPEHGSSVGALLSHAQLACNYAEHCEKKWAFYLNEQNQSSHDLIRLALDLQEALKNDELEIYHQPQVDLKTLRVCGSECLVRWQHKTYGYIMPNVFIPIAENTGIITQLTLWVIEKSLSQHELITENEVFNHMVSINISGKDIQSTHFFENVKSIMERSHISPDKVIFEITESSAIINNQKAVEVINKLTDIGITISIDDFGTGYSSLSYINTLPFQELKIDRQFVEGVCDNPKHKVIAESSVKMAKGLGLEVVAEGINSKLDEDTLRQFGCDIGQGYYYAQPMPIEDYIEWLSHQVNAQIPESHYGEFIPAEK